MNLKNVVKIHPEREINERYKDIISKGLVAHVGFIDEGYPYVIPMSYHYDIKDPNSIYLHGSLKSRLLDNLNKGEIICIEITLLEGLVYSKTALFHSMNYESVICFGKCIEVIDNSEKKEVLTSMITRYFPTRNVNIDFDEPPIEHLEITKLIRMTIDYATAKERKGNPKGPNDFDSNYRGNAGIINI